MKKLSHPHTAAFLLLACLCSALHAAPTRPESGETITLSKFGVTVRVVKKVVLSATP